MRKPILAANWKMHKTLREAVQFVDDIKTQLPNRDIVDTVICAPALFIPAMLDAAQSSALEIGAQTMYFEQSGAFTGEISPVMLEDLGVKYCIIGHSERRELFHETDYTVNKKMQAAFKHHITPIVCVGETLSEREVNATKVKVQKQVELAFANVEKEQAKQAVIAYEPIWAIGTGKTPSSADANEVCGQIREEIKKLYDEETSEAIRIQYGGSVNPANIESLMNEEHIDGALIGGASLDVQSFVTMLGAIKK